MDEWCDLSCVEGAFFRIMFARDAGRVLAGAAAPQGRYHHDEQHALYVSSRPEWTWKAVESYIKSGDPLRVVYRLHVSMARVVDIRNENHRNLLGVARSDSDAPWQPQLASGNRPSTWNVSDKARKSGADGLIYTARTAPERWHLVLFRWNELGGPAVRLDPSREDN